MSDYPRFIAAIPDDGGTREFARSFYGLLAETGYMFRRKDGTMTYIDPNSGPHRILSVDEFLATASHLLDVRRGSGDNERASALTRAEAVVLLGSPQRALLPEIEYVLLEPGVWVRPNGEPLLLAEPGYHPEAKAYYWRSPDTVPIAPRAGTEHLERCFSGVPFLNDAYKNNVFAWLVSGMSLADINPPMLAVTGNDRGVGKSSLVQAAGYILTGQMQNAISPIGAEFEKQLGAKFAAEQRFIMMDNIVTQGSRSFSHAKLASLLTEGRSKAVRRLGQSREISQTGVLFALTANDCKLDQDLATRSLAVALHREQAGPMEPYVLSYAREHRAEIYGELLQLALEREPIAIPEEYRTCRFVDWINYTVPIIVPRFGPMAIREAEDLDDRLQDLFAWGEDHVDQPFTTTSLYNEIVGNPENLAGLWHSISTTRSERGRQTKLGAFLNNTVDKTQQPSPGKTLRLESSGRDPESTRRQYIFREISS